MGEELPTEVDRTLAEAIVNESEFRHIVRRGLAVFFELPSSQTSKPSHVTMRECLCIHLGQAGVQIGNA